MGGSIALRLAVGIGLASILAYVMTPMAVLAAKRFAFYDRPVGYKGHAAPTPYLGGAAVMAAFAIAALFGTVDEGRTLPLLGGVAILWVLGTVDDRRTVSPLIRVLVEFTLAVWLSLLGRGWQLGAGAPLDALVTGVWVVGVINAFNLFDNMDGAASTMALVVGAGACALGWINDNAWSVAASAALCGACLGFLPHNMSRPARIFLGDGGSMPLGFAVAVIVASAARGGGPSVLSLLTGLLLIALPALDTTLVIVSRRRRGISILTGGQDHLTHRTRRRVRTARRVALVLGATQAGISALVIAATQSGAVTLSYLIIVFTVCAGVVILALEQAVEPGPGTLAPAGDALAAAKAAPWLARIPSLGLMALGLGIGLSPFFSSFYDASRWIPIGFVVVVLAAVGCVVRPPRVTLPAGLIGGGLAGLGLFSLLSGLWASDVEATITYANRWLTYAALFLLVTLLLRRRRDSGLILAAIGLGIAVVGASIVVRMLGSDPGTMFVGGRLNSPLGYINGEGCVFAIGVWLALALAERREPWLAGLGAAGATIFASLGLLSQSRGAALASLVAILVAVIVFPGRRRRIFAIAIVLIALAGASGPLLDVYRLSHGVTGPGPAHRAAGALLAAALGCGVVWAALVAGARALHERSPIRRGLLAHWATALALVVLLVPAAVGALHGASIAHTARTQWRAFVTVAPEPRSGRPAQLTDSSSQTRLLTGAGNRYDYWRIAWTVFSAHPVAGVGAGNYTAYYYRARRTRESIENPHSLELQALSELGLVGGLLVGVVLIGAALGASTLLSRARSGAGARTVLVAGGGAFVVWLVDTSGDWMHLLPGVSAVAVVALAVFAREALGDPRGRHTPSVAPTRPRTLRQSLMRPRPLLGGALIALVLTVAGGNLLRQGLAQRYLRQAQGELRRAPQAAIVDADRALRIDGASLDAYYVKAAGEARFNQAGTAQRTLLAAAGADPQNFVTWVLLGDLDLRLHNYGEAARYYGRAHALDPNDPSIAALAAHPARALTPRS